MVSIVLVLLLVQTVGIVQDALLNLVLGIINNQSTHQDLMISWYGIEHKLSNLLYERLVPFVVERTNVFIFLHKGR